MKVKRVKVVGLVRTKADIVAEQVKDVLKAKTLQEALLKSLESQQRLNDLEIFKNVSIHLDAPKSSTGSQDGMEVTFHVKEYRMLSSSVAANAGTQSGDAVGTLPLPYLFVYEFSLLPSLPPSPTHPPNSHYHSHCVTCLAEQSS